MRTVKSAIYPAAVQHSPKKMLLLFAAFCLLCGHTYAQRIICVSSPLNNTTLTIGVLDTLQFDATCSDTSGVTEYEWELSDNITGNFYKKSSKKVKTTFKFKHTGVFTVRVRLKDSTGFSNWFQHPIHVSVVQFPNFTAPTGACVSVDSGLVFTNTSKVGNNGEYQYIWRFYGASQNPIKNPGFAYLGTYIEKAQIDFTVDTPFTVTPQTFPNIVVWESPGTYTVTLEIKDRLNLNFSQPLAKRLR